MRCFKTPTALVCALFRASSAGLLSRRHFYCPAPRTPAAQARGILAFPLDSCFSVCCHPILLLTIWQWNGSLTSRFLLHLSFLWDNSQLGTSLPAPHLPYRATTGPKKQFLPALPHTLHCTIPRTTTAHLSHFGTGTHAPAASHALGSGTRGLGALLPTGSRPARGGARGRAEPFAGNDRRQA